MTDHAPERDPTIVQSFSSAFALLSVGGFGIAAYGVIWHSDAKVRETMASNVWTPQSAIAGL